MYGAQKAKGLFTKLKYKKFQAPISKGEIVTTEQVQLGIRVRVQL